MVNFSGVVFLLQDGIKNGGHAVLVLTNLRTFCPSLFVCHPAGITESPFWFTAPAVGCASSVVGRHAGHARYALPRTHSGFNAYFQCGNDEVGNDLINIGSGFGKFRFWGAWRVQRGYAGRRCGVRGTCLSMQGSDHSFFSISNVIFIFVSPDSSLSRHRSGPQGCSMRALHPYGTGCAVKWLTGSWYGNKKHTGGKIGPCIAELSALYSVLVKSRFVVINWGLVLIETSCWHRDLKKCLELKQVCLP